MLVALCIFCDKNALNICYSPSVKGCIMSFNYPRHLTPDNEQIICIDPASLANTMAGIYRNEDNPQDLVNLLQRGGHVDTFWPNAKPNDWTLRGAFTNITHNGMIRETIIPLLLHLSLIHVR